VEVCGENVYIGAPACGELHVQLPFAVSQQVRYVCMQVCLHVAVSSCSALADYHFSAAWEPECTSYISLWRCSQDNNQVATDNSGSVCGSWPSSLPSFC
jgi:hypothetical protein